MKKHSKGPWTYDKIMQDIMSPEGEVCSFNFSETGPNAEVDIALVCMAPDLLTALELSLGALRQYQEYGESMKEFGRGFQSNYKGYEINSLLSIIDTRVKKAKGSES